MSEELERRLAEVTAERDKFVQSCIKMGEYGTRWLENWVGALRSEQDQRHNLSQLLDAVEKAAGRPYDEMAPTNIVCNAEALVELVNLADEIRKERS